MELKFSTRALIDTESVAEVIQQNSPRSALRFLEAVEKTGENLMTFPEFGARFETDEPTLKDMRVCLVSGFEKYVVFYRVRTDAVRIERVVHGSRDLPTTLKDDT
jgi:toxin ParE1/3/4